LGEPIGLPRKKRYKNRGEKGVFEKYAKKEIIRKNERTRSRDLIEMTEGGLTGHEILKVPRARRTRRSFGGKKRGRKSEDLGGEGLRKKLVPSTSSTVFGEKNQKKKRRGENNQPGNCGPTGDVRNASPHPSEMEALESQNASKTKSRRR